MFVRTRFFQRSVVTASALVLAVGLSACGSDDDTNDGGATSTSSAAVITSATTTPAPTASSAAGASSAAAAAPAAEELQGTLTLIIDPARPIGEKSAVIVNGDARSANLETMTQGLASYGVITFVVENITVNGTTATGNVQITGPHGTMPSQMTWEQVDGTWMLSEASACQLLAMGGAPCA